MTNIFRQAKQLLDKKGDRGMSEKEWELFGAATIPLLILPKYNDTPIGEGLEELARIIGETWQIGES